MSQRKIVEIIAMVMALIVIISLFIPYAGSGDYSISIWEASEGTKHVTPILVILSTIAAAVCLMLHIMGVMKDSKESYIGAGYVGIYCLSVFFTYATSEGGFEGLAVGFWLLVLSGVAMLALSIIAQFLSDEAPAKPQYGAPYGGYNQYGQQPGGYGYPNAQPNVPQQGGYNPQVPPAPQGGYNPYRQ